jgi:HD-GYP domain-containing protein (c-di-GMP phosphodiesterase class II)
VPLLGELLRALGAHDPYTGAHSSRVAALATPLALRLGWDERRLWLLGLVAAVHDVGKLAVAGAVLRKPGDLTPAELEAIQHHPALGAGFVVALPPFRPALGGVLYHHERWDGGGYPSGVAGSAIPIEARILAVADAFDAMTSTRPYRRAAAPERALEEIERCAGTQFDPCLARAFVEAWEAGELQPACSTAA